MKNKSSVIIIFLLLLFTTEVTKALTLSVTGKDSINVLCNGAATGVASCSVSGGTAPYTFSWSNGATTKIATGLSAGTYTVGVVDAVLNVGTATVTITQKTAIVFTGNVGNVSCYGESNGQVANARATGGTSPYTYSWSPIAGTSANITGLSQGTYTMNVTDINGCTGTASFTITQPTAISLAIASQTNVSCVGGSNGSATANPASGGTSPYRYRWTPNGGATVNASNLSAGAYTLTVTDNNFCTATASVIITQPAPLSLSPRVYDANCGGRGIFTAYSGLKGGTSPYTYSWSANQTTANATGLDAGVYSVVVTDSCGGTVSASLTIPQPTIISVTTDSVNATGPCNGMAKVIPYGGIPPYTYSWSAGGTADSLTGQCAGTYCCTITDNYGCDQSACVTIGGYAAINEIANKTGIKIAPDPNNGIFYVEGIGKGMIVEIYDYTGKKLITSNVVGYSINIDISTQPDGIYLIRILNRYGSLVTQNKIVKTN